MDAYPEQLAALVRKHWGRSFKGGVLVDLPACSAPSRLPRAVVLRQLLSVCYQASLLRDEGRPVRFRLILCEPEAFAGSEDTPYGLCVLPFSKPRGLTTNNLRRLASAAPVEHALISTRIRRGGGLEIWGLVHSGEAWLRALEGRRRAFPMLPPVLVINVTGPGNLTVGKGSLAVTRLLGGRVVTPAPGVLEVKLANPEDAAVNALFLTAHQRNRAQRGRSWAQVGLLLVGQFRRQIALRLLNAMRRLNHGGTLIILPLALVRQSRRWQRVLKLNYAFPPSPARRRLFTLVLDLIAALADDCGRRFGPRHQVKWRDYLDSSDAAVRRADEAITEAIHFLAGLSAVDGALVIGQPLELLGFGAEISGQLHSVDEVARALNVSGTRIRMESVLNEGTRHRSAYRLCQALSGVVAVVISQDGSLRIAKRAGDHVIFSQHFGTGALDL